MEMPQHDDARVVAPELAPSSISRWRCAIRFGRLGVVAATVLGTSIALNIGGTPWSRVIVEWCLGLPFSFPLAWLDILSPNAALGPPAPWGWQHLALGLCLVASWAGIGAVIDVVRQRRSDRDSSSPIAPPRHGADGDSYLRAAESDVEAFLRGESVPIATHPEEDASGGKHLRTLLSNVRCCSRALFGSGQLCRRVYRSARSGTWASIAKHETVYS
jgi:hypothetical protein